jgi:hypothetical protein
MCLSKKTRSQTVSSRPTIVAVQRRWSDLAVNEVPVDLVRELHQFLPRVDDLPTRGTDHPFLSSFASSADSVTCPDLSDDG